MVLLKKTMRQTFGLLVTSFCLNYGNLPYFSIILIDILQLFTKQSPFAYIWHQVNSSKYKPIKDKFLIIYTIQHKPLFSKLWRDNFVYSNKLNIHDLPYYVLPKRRKNWLIKVRYVLLMIMCKIYLQCQSLSKNNGMFTSIKSPKENTQNNL